MARVPVLSDDCVGEILADVGSRVRLVAEDYDSGDRIVLDVSREDAAAWCRLVLAEIDGAEPDREPSR